MANLQEIAKLGTTPVPGESPTGMNPQYEPEFEKLQTEINKLEDVNKPPIKWTDIIRTASEILAQKSKHLMVGSYLTLGLTQTDGYKGLAAGLGVMKDLLSTFWDKLFPPIEKLRGRGAAFTWMSERVGRAVTEMQPAGRSDRDTLTGCKTTLGELEALITEKFAGNEAAPGLGDIGRAVGEKLEAIPKPEEPKTEGTTESAPAGEAAPATSAEIDSPDKAREAVLKAVDFLRKANEADPLPYRLVRALFWSEVADLPDHTHGQTTIPGGDATLLDGWDKALGKKEFARVLNEAEDRFKNDKLWLDLNLYVCRAMEGLGSAYEPARTAVQEQLGGFVRRLPELTTLKFDGGAPFATEATRTWILNEVAAPAAASAEPNRLETTMAEARKLVARKKLQEATALFQREMQGVPQGRERFLWRLNLAKLCVDAGKHPMALPQLESLDEEGQRFQLELWDPGLCIEVVKLLWQCYSAVSSDKAGPLYSRLCKLDLTAAMALDGKK